MAKTGGAITKLQEKSKRNATTLKLGSHRAIISRNTSSYHEKAVAFEAHRRLILDHAINLGCRVTDITKDGSKQAVTFQGDGLSDDSLGGVRVAKTNQERAAEDKRAPLKSEWKSGWRPGKFGRCY